MSNVTPLTIALPRWRRPAVPDATAVAVVEAVRAPAGPVVSLIAAVRPPAGETQNLVVNLTTFTLHERAEALHRLGRELARRWPGVRLFVGRAGLPLDRARRCLENLQRVSVEAGRPCTLHLDTADPACVLSRAGTIVLPSRRVTVATDGARNPSTGVSAAGYVTDTGLAWAARCQYDGVVEAEVTAICMVMEALPLHDLEVLTDSRPALRIVRDALAGRPTRFRLHRMLRRALDHHGGATTVRWVPGHAGHPLNEAADRLVRAERREAEGRAAPGSARRVRANVREDILAAWTADCV
ncbi:MAG: ribonuclease H family protein [Actinomyces sp.]|uniref:ribonuclease H family protein n=1 Tax=Actinomyces sp. TaxID=29317 RepID=UPI0026DCFC0F|nr:ribonuclease H family protein [Actinomyces sp.]MDO4244366.1 ribonuclease H family protein [Actinomyces sp.]